MKIALTLFCVFTILSCKKKNKVEPAIDLSAARRSLVSCYSFDGNANDSKGLNNGVVVGATLTEDRFGNAQKAYLFNGNSRIDISTNQLINSEFAWCAWIKPTNLPKSGTAQIILSLGGSGGDQSLAINHDYFTDTKDKSKWILGNYVGYEKTNNFAIVDDAIEQDKWYFVSAVRSKDSLAVYVNAALKTKIYSGGVPPYYGATSQPTGKLGSRYTNGQNFIGVMDDMKFFKTTLTQAEIKGLYAIKSCDF